MRHVAFYLSGYATSRIIEQNTNKKSEILIRKIFIP